MRSGSGHGSGAWRSVAAGVSAAVLLTGGGLGVVPPPIVVGYSLMSSLAFMLYRRDKRAAQAGRMRTRERTLHLVDLLGGWPGGLLAQGRLRHKTRKVAFQLVFWATVLLNCIVLGWLINAGLAA